MADGWKPAGMKVKMYLYVGLLKYTCKKKKTRSALFVIHCQSPDSKFSPHQGFQLSKQRTSPPAELARHKWVMKFDVVAAPFENSSLIDCRVGHAFQHLRDERECLSRLFTCGMSLVRFGLFQA